MHIEIPTRKRKKFYRIRTVIYLTLFLNSKNELNREKEILNSEKFIIANDKIASIDISLRKLEENAKNYTKQCHFKKKTDLENEKNQYSSVCFI